MILIIGLAYFLAGLWSAERFREKQRDISKLHYVSVVLLWPAFWFMAAIVAEEDETETGDDHE